MAAPVDIAPDTKSGDEPAAAPPRRGDPPPSRRGGARPGAGRPRGAKTGTGARAKPKPAAATTTATAKQEDVSLVANLTKLLELPVIPARQVGFAFAVAHFSEAAAPTAELIVQASKTWPELRHVLTNADTLISGKVLAVVAIASYLAPVGAYMLGQENLAYGISKASPQQVQSIELMLQLPPEVAIAVQTAQAQGASDAVLTGIVEAHYAAQAATHPGNQQRGTPTAPSAAAPPTPS